MSCPNWIGAVEPPASHEVARLGRAAAIAEAERSCLEVALKKTGGNQSQAARLLGISRATLIYRMKKHELA
ncbi:MAG TPA: helix-turn-helix domain-containing protein [bacterium]|nr:helix-turn-helix domain-containing protein [bacterium]